MDKKDLPMVCRWLAPPFLVLLAASFALSWLPGEKLMELYQALRAVVLVGIGWLFVVWCIVEIKVVKRRRVEG